MASVILLDANVLLYAIDSGSDHHERALEWLEGALNGSEAVGFSQVVLLAVMRIATNATVYANPLTVDEAASDIAAWLALPVSQQVHPTAKHWQTLAQVATAGQARGSMMTDAHLATLAIEHGAQLATTDRDFTRFPGLRLINPLDPPG